MKECRETFWKGIRQKKTTFNRNVKMLHNWKIPTAET